MSDSGKAADLLAQLPRGRGPAPVHLWNPAFCGDIDMRIARDGTWYYMGSPIGRKAMVQLFSNIIRRDGDDYFLVTPVEKVGIRVDDAPFVAVLLDVQGEGVGQVLTLTTQVDEQIVIGAQHPLRVELDPLTAQPAPYVTVRGNLEALLHRNVFYQLVDLLVSHEHNAQRWLGVWSSGVFFPVGLDV